MISFGGFILGLFFFTVGFFMVRKTDFFLNNFGDIGEMLGFYNSSWASWKFAGVAFMILGFLIAFGLIHLFFLATIGRLFLIGNEGS